MYRPAIPVALAVMVVMVVEQRAKWGMSYERAMREAEGGRDTEGRGGEGIKIAQEVS